MSVLLGGRAVEVIDAHVHTFPDAIAPGAVGRLQKISGITPFTNGTVSDTLQKMELCGIDRALSLNIATAPKQQTTINNCAKELMGREGARLIPFGSIHFEAENALTELERIQEMGLRGIKLHPDYQGFLIDDERLFPVYEKCARLGLPIVFHAGWDCYSPDLVHAPPEASLRVHRQFPNLKMVLAHFGGLNRWNEVERYLIGQDVWLDTAMCASYADQKQIERMILRHDPEKILLGSDCPWESPSRSVQFVMEMALPDSLKERILAGNVKKLLSLAG